MKPTIEQIMQEAIAAHKEGKLEDAERLYRLIFKSQPKHPDANHNLGVLAVSVNNVSAALPLFKTALESNPNVKQFWLSYIETLIKAKQLKEVTKILEEGKKTGRLTEKELNSFKAKLTSIAQSATDGDLAPSQRQINNLFEYYQNGRTNDAENLAITLSKQFPEHPFSWKVLGVLFGQKGNKSEALIASQKAVETANQDPEAHCNLGVAFEELDKLKEGEASYRKAITLKPDYAEAHSNLGTLLQRTKRLGEAKSIFKKAISLKPGDANAHNNLGTVLQGLGQVEEARESYTKAITLKPDFIKAYNNLGTAFQELNILEEAKENFRKAIELKPDYAEAHYNYGLSLKGLGRLVQAETSFKKAIELKPDYAKAYSNWGITLQELGKLEKSEACFRKAIHLKPDYAEAHYNYGITLKDLNRLEESEASYKSAIALKLDFPKAHNNLGTLLKEVGKLQEAEASFKKAIELKPESAEANSNFGALLKELGKVKQATASFKKAIKLKPDYAEAHNNLGILCQEMANLEEADASFRKAIELKPDYAEAHRHLASIKKFISRDKQFLKMLELYQSETISEKQLCHINFALAKAYEDLGDCEQSFKHYKEGNTLRKKLLNYNISQDIKLFTQFKNSYSKIKKNALKLDNSTKEPIPIFIIGMPRSGTTLVEQIISSHSQVTGAGELTFVAEFGEALAIGLSETTKDELIEFRKRYLMKLKSLSNGNMFVTDKMPQNFYYLGLLTAAIPEAKIVHVQRDPAAVCWANYKQYFNSKNLGYCYDLNDIVSYYAHYKKLMQHWNKLFYDRIYNLNYELLTVNLEDETRKLINYLSLAWDGKCLSPQNNVRRVTTASNIQIRQGVYQGSSQKWKKFEPFLNGVLKDL